MCGILTGTTTDYDGQEKRIKNQHMNIEVTSLKKIVQHEKKI